MKDSIKSNNISDRSMCSSAAEICFPKLSIQHVPKSTAPTELTEQIKGVGEIPIPLLHCISVSLKYYGYSMISPIGRAISDVGLTNLPFWESGRIPQILGRTEHNFVLSEYN